MKAFITIFLLTLSLHAANLSTNKTTYVVVSLNGVTGPYSNWVGIFKQGSTNSWENVVDAIWFYREDSLTFDNLPGGDYEARLFYRDSLNREASSNNFTVAAGDATISTDRASYNNGETITVTLENVQGASNNFVAIFKEGDTSDWNHYLGNGTAQWFDFRDGTVKIENINLA